LKNISSERSAFQETMGHVMPWICELEIKEGEILLLVGESGLRQINLWLFEFSAGKMRAVGLSYYDEDFLS
jgi:hypothetical protein